MRFSLFLIFLVYATSPAAQTADMTASRLAELGVLAERILAVETGSVPEALTRAMLAQETIRGDAPLSEQVAGMNLGAMRSLERKSAVMVLSRLLEERASPRRIAKIYAATVYYGRNCYGHENAVRGLARQRPDSAGDDVWLALAALPRSPSLYLRDRSALRARVDRIIDAMEAGNLIDEEVAATLRGQKLANVDSGRGCTGR